MIDELMHDIRSAIRSFPQTDPRFASIELVQQALLRSNAFLVRNPTTLLQTLWNWCYWHTDRSFVKHAMRDLSAVEAIRLAVAKSNDLIVKQHDSFDVENDPNVNSSAKPRPQMSGEILRKWLESKRAESTEFSWMRLLRPPMATRDEASITVLEGHRDSVERLVITDDDLIISASRDQSIRVWDYSTGKELLEIAHPGDRVADMVLIPNTRHIATASWAGDTFRVYKIDNGELIGILSLTPSVPLSIDVNQDARTAAVGCDDGAIYVIDVQQCVVLKKLASDSKSSVMAVSFSCCGSFLVTGGRREEIDVWNTNDWSLKGTVVPERISHTYPNRETEAIRCSPVDQVFATGHVDGSVRLWDLQSLTEVHRNQVLTHCLLSLSFSRDGRFILATGHYGESALCDAKTTRVIRQLRAHNAHVFSGALSSTGAWCATSSADKTVHVFCLATPGQIAENHAAFISSFMICGKSKVITAGLDAFIREWNSDTGELQTRYVAGNGIWSCAADSKGVRLYALRIDGKIEEVNMASNSATSEWIADIRCRQGAVAVSSDDNILAVAIAGRVFLHRLDQRKVPPPELANVASPYPCVDSIDLTDSEARAGVTDLVTSRLPFDELIKALAALRQTVPERHACCLQFSPCGQFLACGFTSGQVNLVCLKTHEQIVLRGNYGTVHQLAISHGGTIVAADAEGGLARWDVSVPERPQVFERGDPANAIQFQNDDSEIRYELLVASEQLVLVSNRRVRTWIDGNARFVKCVIPSRLWLISDGIQIGFLKLEVAMECDHLLRRLRRRVVLGIRDGTTFTCAENGIYILAYDKPLLGELNVLAFKKAIWEALNFDDLDRLILDYSNVESMSSNAIGMLYGVRSTIQKRGGRLTLVGLNAYLREVFLNNSLDKYFEIVDNVNEAIEDDSPHVSRRKSSLQEAFLRLSGVERRAVAAIRNGNLSRGVAIVVEAISLPIQEYGPLSIQAGAANMTAGRICFLAKRWQDGSDHFSDAYQAFSYFLGQDHPLTVECNVLHALCLKASDR